MSCSAKRRPVDTSLTWVNHRKGGGGGVGEGDKPDMGEPQESGGDKHDMSEPQEGGRGDKPDMGEPQCRMGGGGQV